MSKLSKYKNGFTLIELMVVIAVIGILTSVILSTLNTARAKGRDTRRLSDIRQLQTALELYYNTNGVYPASGTGNSGNPGGTWVSSETTEWTSNFGPLISQYISKPPLDPVNSGGVYAGTGYSYAYFNSCSGKGYFIMARLEKIDPTKYNNPVLTDCGAGPYNYLGTQPGLFAVGIGS